MKNSKYISEMIGDVTMYLQDEFKIKEEAAFYTAMELMELIFCMIEENYRNTGRKLSSVTVEELIRDWNGIEVSRISKKETKYDGN